jgi:hypothetical protein
LKEREKRRTAEKEEISAKRKGNKKRQREQ